MAEVSPSHLLPWSHHSCPVRSHHSEPAGPSNCVFLSSAGRGIGQQEALAKAGDSCSRFAQLCQLRKATSLSWASVFLLRFR